MKEITIYDIAEKLDISSSTVSRALKNNPIINEDTRKLVNDYAREVGYRSNNFARNLRVQKSNTIGVIVPRLDSDFMSSCLAGMEEVASEKGYDLLITQSQESAQKEEENSTTLFNKRVDGILVSLTREESNLSYFRRFEAKKVPVLYFDRVPNECAHSCFGIDNERMSYLVGRHLLEQGCKNLAHLTIRSHLGVYLERIRGFERALSGSQDVKSQIIYLDDLNLEDGKASAESIIGDHIDGVFAANDLVATGCLLALQERGKLIPDEVAIIGFNDDQVATIVSPKLTTVSYSGIETGRRAIKNLLELMESQSSGDFGARFETELILRESSVRKNKK